MLPAADALLRRLWQPGEGEKCSYTYEVNIRREHENVPWATYDEDTNAARHHVAVEGWGGRLRCFPAGGSPAPYAFHSDHGGILVLLLLLLYDAPPHGPTDDGK